MRCYTRLLEDSNRRSASKRGPKKKERKYAGERVDPTFISRSATDLSIDCRGQHVVLYSATHLTAEVYLQGLLHSCWCTETRHRQLAMHMGTGTGRVNHASCHRWWRLILPLAHAYARARGTHGDYPAIHAQRLFIS
jgi:hypothetical protein